MLEKIGHVSSSSEIIPHDATIAAAVTGPVTRRDGIRAKMTAQPCTQSTTNATSAPAINRPDAR
jgi:hypothetical protein